MVHTDYRQRKKSLKSIHGIICVHFKLVQSNHERTAWGDRNGVVGSVGGPPGVAGPEESNRGGGSWRSRESFGGRRVSEEGTNDDGWRKPRWRRGDEAEDEYRSGSNSRRLHRSWSEEENHDNIPEWYVERL